MGNQIDLIRSLSNPRLYGASCTDVHVIETHISYVLLTGREAFKIKKAVRLPFLDFTTLDARRFFCEREVELNSRLAPGVYIGVVPITGSAAVPEFDGGGPAIEYAVKMRQFSQDALFTRMLAAGRLTGAHIDELADVVAAFHESAARVAPEPLFGSAGQALELALENFTEIEPLLRGESDRRTVAALREWTAREHDGRRHAFVQRHRDGFIRGCHADLHLGNIALIEGKPTLFDCVEFSEPIRWSDVMADVGFLVMDLIDRGRATLASRFLNRYLEETGDYGGLRVLRFYAVYRAMVRAKVACMRASQIGNDAAHRAAIQEFRQYLRLGRRMSRSVDRGVIITNGPSGSGKTTGTGCLIENMNAVRVRTDIVRKRLNGLSALNRSGSALNGGIYTPVGTARTYDAVADIVRTIVNAGYVAIADGTFLRAEQRQMFADLARTLDVPFAIVKFTADRETLAARVTQRQQSASDASEATLDVLREQLQRDEPLRPEEQSRTITIGTPSVSARSRS